MEIPSTPPTTRGPPPAVLPGMTASCPKPRPRRRTTSARGKLGLKVTEADKSGRSCRRRYANRSARSRSQRSPAMSSRR